MVPFLMGGVFSLARAIALITPVVRLVREQRSPALLPYLLYLVFWYALILYMHVFLFSPWILPEDALHGYLLYNSILVVPLHGLIAFFFANYIWRLLGRRMPKLLKLALPVAFLAILVVYARELFSRLAMETEQARFVLAAPISGHLMFACLLGVLFYASFVGRSLKDRTRGRQILAYALTTTGGLLIGLLFVTGILSIGAIGWNNALTSAILAAVHLPGWLCIRGYFDRQPPIAAVELAGADLSRLQERFRITRREREIISLVIQGRSNREITEQLFISPDTVKKHIYNIYRKIGVRNRVELVNAVLDLSWRRGTE